MISFTSLNLVRKTLNILFPGMLIFASFCPQLSAQPRPEWKVSLEFPPADDRGAPSRSVGGGTRGPSCIEKDTPPLTALTPTRSNIGTTASTNPTIFLYVPKTIAKLAEFVVVDDAGNEVYASNFSLPGTDGIVKLNVPQSASLKVGKDYLWQFALVCDDEDRSNDQFIRGKIRPIELSLDLQQKLQEAASPLEKAKLLADAKIWNETLTIIADLRSTNPNEWEQLLTSIGLENLASEPIVDCCTANRKELVIGKR